MAKIPRPFLSHAHADKERFVLDFAKRLRGKGIDVWVDSWEMLPGDSLVDKIFNEGLKSCTAFIVVLSNNSVNSRWVREELNAGIVKRINDNTKLIPIRLDHCEVPIALADTLWVDIPDVHDYDTQFERVVNTIFGQFATSPLGNPPAYVRPDVLQLEGLAPIESLILAHACKIAIEQGSSTIVHGGRIVSELAEQDVSEHQIMESQEILEGRLYIERYLVMGTPHAYDFKITSYGFDQFVRAAIPEYGKLSGDVARLLVRDQHESNFSIAEELKQPIMIIDHILESFKHNGMVRSTQTMNGQIHIFWVSPELRRKLDE